MALATPVSITSIAVAGNVATVTTSAAHGLLATLPSAFVITGCTVAADNVCGVVQSVPNATTFTFNFPSAWAVAAASNGSVAPARRWIALTTDSTSSPGNLIIDYILWIAVTNPAPGSSASRWIAQGSSAGASNAENNAIAAGYLIERAASMVRPVGTPGSSLIVDLDTIWTNAQNAQTGGTQPMGFYGFVWDGTGTAQI